MSDQLNPPSAAPNSSQASDAGGPDMLGGLTPPQGEQQKLVQMRLAGVEITIFAPPATLAGAVD